MCRSPTREVGYCVVAGWPVTAVPPPPRNTQFRALPAGRALLFLARRPGTNPYDGIRCLCAGHGVEAGVRDGELTSNDAMSAVVARGVGACDEVLEHVAVDIGQSLERDATFGLVVATEVFELG